MTKTNNLRNLLFAIATTALLLCPAYSHAQTQDRDSLGLYDTNNENSLGYGILHQTKRSALNFHLVNAKRTEWPSINTAIKNLLLTSASTETLIEDISVNENNDILTLKLQALLNLGYYKEALELFNKVDQENISGEKTIRLGILSMLLNAEKGLACLEVKTHFPKFHDQDFWKKLNAYCSLSLSKEKNPTYLEEIKGHPLLISLIETPDFAITYNAQTISTLSKLERAILISENAIQPPSQREDLNNIAPQDIASLLNQSNLTDEQLVILSALAVKYAIISPQDLTNLYQNLAKKYDENKTTPSGIANIVTLYSKTADAIIPINRKKDLQEAIKLASGSNEYILIPLLENLVKLDAVDDLTPAQAHKILKLMISNKISLPENWIKDFAKATPEAINEKQQIGKLLLSSILLSESVDKKWIESSQNNLTAYVLSSSTAMTYKNIIENIDSQAIFSDKDYTIYENDFDLLSNKGYTMPPSILMDMLRKSSKNQNIAETLLLSGLILSIGNEKSLYSNTLGEVTLALSEIGNKQLARNILAQAILEQQ